MQHAALLKNMLQCSVQFQCQCKVMCPQVVSIRVQDQVWGGGWRGLGAGHRPPHRALTIQSSKSVPWVSVTQLYYKCFQNYFSIT